MFMLKIKYFKEFALLVTLLMLSTSVAAVNGVVKTSQPNIVFLFADDLGWTDLSVNSTNLGNGSKYYQTPNLEKFASAGMSFSSMYMCQNCAPSRAALLSGEYAPRTLIYNVSSLDRGDKNSVIKPISQTNELNPDLITIAETLKKAGYITAHFGKWGVGNRSEIEKVHGFDISYSTAITGVKQKIKTGYFPKKDENGDLQFSMYGDMVGSKMQRFTEPYNLDYINKYLLPYANNNDPSILDGTPKHLTDAMADATADFLRNERLKYGKNKPFFMYVAFNQVHVPIEPRIDLVEKYKKIKSADTRHANVAYAAFTEQLDQVCARIVDQLKDPNGDGDTSDDISDNTIIIFSSDNGGLGGNVTSNGPLRGYKGMQYDGGVRVPLIVCWKNRIPSGKICNIPVHVIDIYPTLAEFAGANLPEASMHPLDGESLAPILLGKSDKLKREAIFGHFPGYMDSRSVPTTYVVRSFGTDQYKMLYFYETQVYELYNISKDIGESNNLLDGKPSSEIKKVAEILRNDILLWLEKMTPEPMTYRSTGKSVPLPIPLN